MLHFLPRLVRQQQLSSLVDRRDVSRQLAFNNCNENVENGSRSLVRFFGLRRTPPRGERDLPEGDAVPELPPRGRSGRSEGKPIRIAADKCFKSLCLRRSSLLQYLGVWYEALALPQFFVVPGSKCGRATYGTFGIETRLI